MIDISDSFENTSKDPIDEKMIFESCAKMLSVSDQIDAGILKTYPDSFFCICKADNCMYQYNKTNLRNVTSGRFEKTPKRNVGTVVYGFRINRISTEDDPIPFQVEYLPGYDNFGYTPLHADPVTGKISLGSWKEDEFFMPRPCMLKYDGTVDYYLDINDYSKKEDGTPSNVWDSSYQGNAMMEWGRDDNQIWYKIVPDEENNDWYSSESANVYISNKKLDDEYHAWSFIGRDHTIVDTESRPEYYKLKNHFYTSIYMVTTDWYKSVSSGEEPVCSSLPWMLQQAANYTPDLPHNGWSVDIYSDRVLINLILVLLCKTLDLRSIFGVYSKAEVLCPAGKGDQLGMFGKFPNNECGKILGMEYFWNSRFTYMLGLRLVHVNEGMYNGSVFEYKMCLGTEDGSTVCEYQDDYIYYDPYVSDGYIHQKITAPVSDYGSILTFGFRSDGSWLPATAEPSRDDTRDPEYMPIDGGYTMLKTSDMITAGEGVHIMTIGGPMNFRRNSAFSMQSQSQHETTSSNGMRLSYR